MIVKKSGKNVIGAHLTVAEKKAMEIEINRQIAESRERLEFDMENAVLYVLNKEFGFGEQRLKRFYICFKDVIESLLEHYEMDDSDAVWLCAQKLKDMGIDLKEWRENLKED